MGRKATGRLTQTTSVSLRAEDEAFLKEHHLSATECIRRWIDHQRDHGEATLILLSIEQLKIQITEKERAYGLAVEREARVRELEKRQHGQGF